MKNKTLMGLCVSLLPNLLCAQSLTFSKAYDLALENSHAVKSAHYNYKSETQKIEGEKSALYPHINLSSSYKKAEYYSKQSTSRQTVKNYTLSLKQSVYNADTYARINIQKERAKYAKLDAKQKKMKITQYLFTTYLDILKSKARIKLLESQKTYNQSMLEKIKKQYGMNLSDKVNFLEIKVEFNSIKIELNKERKRYLSYMQKLKNLIDKRDIHIASLDLDRNMNGLFNTMKRVSGAIPNSLDIQQAKALLDMKRYQVNQAKAAYYPKIDIDMAYSRYNMDSVTIQNPYEKTDYAMLSLTMPIYSGGFRSEALQASRLAKKAAYEDFLQARKDADINYENALSILKSSISATKLYKEAYNNAKLYVQAVQKKYEKGLASIVEYNKSRQKFYNIRYEFVNNIYDMIKSYIQILMEIDNVKDIKLLDNFLKDSK